MFVFTGVGVGVNEFEVYVKEVGDVSAFPLVPIQAVSGAVVEGGEGGVRTGRFGRCDDVITEWFEGEEGDDGEPTLALDVDQLDSFGGGGGGASELELVERELPVASSRFRSCS